MPFVRSGNLLKLSSINYSAKHTGQQSRGMLHVCLQIKTPCCRFSSKRWADLACHFLVQIGHKFTRQFSCFLGKTTQTFIQLAFRVSPRSFISMFVAKGPGYRDVEYNFLQYTYIRTYIHSHKYTYIHELQPKLMEVKSGLRMVFGFWKWSWDPKNDIIYSACVCPTQLLPRLCQRAKQDTPSRLGRCTSLML